MALEAVCSMVGDACCVMSVALPTCAAVLPPSTGDAVPTRLMLAVLHSFQGRHWITKAPDPHHHSATVRFATGVRLSSEHVSEGYFSRAYQALSLSFLGKQQNMHQVRAVCV